MRDEADFEVRCLNVRSGMLATYSALSASNLCTRYTTYLHAIKARHKDDEMRAASRKAQLEKSPMEFSPSPLLVGPNYIRGRYGAFEVFFSVRSRNIRNERMPRTGRPELDDDETLLAMANVVLKNPQIAIADAIRSVMVDFSHEQSEEAAIRRLRDKFKSKRPLLLATVQRDVPRRRVYLMSPNRVSFQPAAFFKISEALQRSINLPEMRRVTEQMTQMQKRLVSPEMQRIGAVMAHNSERMQRALNTPEVRRFQERLVQVERQFNTPEMQRMRKTLEAARTSFNTPEMRHMIERAQNASNVIARLNLQRFS